ncbi:hypothetical protein PsorP6_014233 [Peronosclerospora sorghi]|uniref:Uncharacterized protein n=1 Tax=Peronosclerospora sorghi TaxID=230839 RepID=A0ACC0VI56_9STRA|nr:hypothetical protein PsorP6_014233 [Peronosclerospora sorghi]
MMDELLADLRKLDEKKERVEDASDGMLRVQRSVNAMTILARMAETMATQQHQMAQLLQHQRVVLDQLGSGRSTVEKRVEGFQANIPRSRGRAAASFPKTSQVVLQRKKH